LLLDALRSADPNPMRPAEAIAWIRARIDVPDDDLTCLIVNGKQSIFENDIHWTRFYLAKAGLVSKPKRGLWALTPEGRDTHLTADETWALYVRIRDANRPDRLYLIYALRNGPGESGSAVDHLVTPETLG
jgi:5-methylcytosine-specific restriction protein B